MNLYPGHLHSVNIKPADCLIASDKDVEILWKVTWLDIRPIAIDCPW
jgi:hypothetical protein